MSNLIRLGTVSLIILLLVDKMRLAISKETQFTNFHRNEQTAEKATKSKTSKVSSKKNENDTSALKKSPKIKNDEPDSTPKSLTTSKSPKLVSSKGSSLKSPSSSKNSKTPSTNISGGKSTKNPSLKQPLSKEKTSSSKSPSININIGKSTKNPSLKQPSSKKKTSSSKSPSITIIIGKSTKNPSLKQPSSKKKTSSSKSPSSSKNSKRPSEKSSNGKSTKTPLSPSASQKKTKSPKNPSTPDINLSASPSPTYSPIPRFSKYPTLNPTPQSLPLDNVFTTCAGKISSADTKTLVVGYKYSINISPDVVLDDRLKIVERQLETNLVKKALKCSSARERSFYARRRYRTLVENNLAPIGLSSSPLDVKNPNESCQQPLTPSINSVCHVIDGSLTAAYDKNSTVDTSAARLSLLEAIRDAFLGIDGVTFLESNSTKPPEQITTTRSKTPANTKRFAPVVACGLVLIALVLFVTLRRRPSTRRKQNHQEPTSGEVSGEKWWGEWPSPDNVSCEDLCTEVTSSVVTSNCEKVEVAPMVCECNSNLCNTCHGKPMVVFISSSSECEKWKEVILPAHIISKRNSSFIDDDMTELSE